MKTDYTKYNTNWSSPKRNWITALRSLRQALAANHNAKLVKLRNEECAHPIKFKNNITDFRAYEFQVGLLKSRDSIENDYRISTFEKHLTLNYKNCYGTPEAVKQYYDKGLLSHDNFKGIGKSHLVNVKDMIKYYASVDNKFSQETARTFQQQYLWDNTKDRTYFFDHFKLNHNETYTIKKFKRKLWVVALIKADDKVKTHVPMALKIINVILFPLKYIPKRSTLKMKEYRQVTYRIGSVINGFTISIQIPKKFSFK